VSTRAGARALVLAGAALWAQARTAAVGYTFLGVPGHLVAVAGPDWPVALLGDSQLLRLFDGGR
jgi:hypothetical protein